MPLWVNRRRNTRTINLLFTQMYRQTKGEVSASQVRALTSKCQCIKIETATSRDDGKER